MRAIPFRLSPLFAVLLLASFTALPLRAVEPTTTKPANVPDFPVAIKN